MYYICTSKTLSFLLPPPNPTCILSKSVSLSIFMHIKIPSKTDVCPSFLVSGTSKQQALQERTSQHLLKISQVKPLQADQEINEPSFQVSGNSKL